MTAVEDDYVFVLSFKGGRGGYLANAYVRFRGGVLRWWQYWENTVRRKCENGFFEITNAKKSCQIMSSRQLIWRDFGMSDLEKPILTSSISQYSPCRKLQMHIWRKKLIKQQQSEGNFHVQTFKRWVKLMFTLFVPQFYYYSSFLQWHLQKHFFSQTS